MTKYNKYVDEKDEFFIDTPKDKHNLGTLRQDFELFDDDKHVKQEVISVKRVNLPNNGERWEILKDSKVEFTLQGVRLSKKEKNFLKTSQGILLIMNGYKSGWNTTAEFKRQIKKCL